MCDAFATSIASNLVSKLGEYLFGPIGRQFGYVLSYKSNVKDLKKEVNDLKNARERVQSSVDKALYDRKPIFTDVKDWLKSVKNEAEEAENLLRDGESAKDACFRGWLPNPVVRHSIGRKVKKMTQVIKELHKKNNFPDVHYDHPPIGIVTATTSTTRSADNNEDVLESRASFIEKVIKAIAYDKVCVVGVYGPGGVGKSKVLADIERRAKKEKLFDVVALAEVSRNPDLRRIQGEIAYALGLNIMNEETTHGRADLLCRRLESYFEKRILIILDNMWTKLELNEVGIPCRYDNKVKGCNLLITSRNREVLSIDMCSDQDFRLNELNDGEARRLFERTVGKRVNDPDIKPWVDGVVKNCGGLPLLIVSSAKRLKHGELAAWRNASTHIDVSDVKSIAELNYNELGDERIRKLFLVCALYSSSIHMRCILAYSMGLDLYKQFSMTIESARDRLVLDLRCLQNSSLLLDSDDIEDLKMHDIFVDMAISITSTEWKALIGRKDYGFKEWSKDDLSKCTAISFPFVGIDKLPEKLDCPNLKMFLLAEDNESLKFSDSFFESTEKLQVLDLTCLSFTSLPTSIKLLENLNSLYLDYCHLEDVTVLGKLKGLQFLSFHGSIIARLPKEIGGLTELRFLDLRECFKLQIIEPGVLESLVNLEELYIDGFCQWEAEDEAPRSNASLADLKNMKKLRTLHITIPHSTNFSSDLPFGNLKEYKIQIGAIAHGCNEYKESRSLKLNLDSGNLLREVCMQECLGRTQDLCFDGLQDDRDSIHDLCTKGFQELKHLCVKNNLSFQYVVGSTQSTGFMRLESLVLQNLNNFKKICRHCLTPESFSKLKIVKVENCDEIKHLFPSSMTRIFLQLEEIEINRCHLMQQIVGDDEIDEYRDEIDDDANVKSCKLRRLTLQNLPEMMSFYKTVDHSVVFLDGQQVSLPLLEYLTLSELPKLKEIWNSQFPSDVSNLKFLKVENCAFLLSVFPSNLVTKLQNLEAITIERCQLIREVFDVEELTTSGDVKILSRLMTLTLSDLPRLGHILNKNSRIALCFRNLRVLKVQGCENLRFIFSSSLAKELKQIRKIKIARCKLLEEIINVQEEESKKGASMHTLEFPLLSSLSLEELPNLRTFSHGTHRIHCPTLTRLRIFGCPKMMTFSSFQGKQQTIATNTGLQQALGGVNSSMSLSILFDQNILFPSLEELTVVSCGLMKIWHNELSKESFCELASITIRDCENLSHIFPSNKIEVFKSLEMIEVVNCTSLESLIEHVAVNTKKMPKSLVFRNLNEMKLWDLPRLDALVTSSSEATLSLPSLTTVSLRNCHSLRYLFTYDTSRTLVKLEMLDVSDCNKMQKVVAMEESEERNLKAMKFSRLQTLKLCSLKSLISFSLGSCAFEFPSLTNLSILECTELKAFILRLPMPRVETTNEGTAGSDESPPSLFDEKVLFPSLEELKLWSMCQLKRIWHNQLHGRSFCKLASLTVELCENLSHVFPSNSMDMLQSLSKIEVVGCPSLEALFEPLAFPKLEELHIKGVQQEELWNSKILMESFCCLKALQVKQCHNLVNVIPSFMSERLLHYMESLTVEECPRLRNLFTISMAKSLGQLQYLGLSGCGEMEYIVTKEDQKSEEAIDKIVIPQLVTLYLHNMPKLRSFCQGKHISEWPSLKGFTIEDCKAVKVILGDASLEGNGPTYQPLLLVEKVEFPTMESMKILHMDNMEKIWLDDLDSNAFGKLKTLVVEHCEKVLSIFSSYNMLTRFQNLEKIIVTDCGSLEVVFQVQEFEFSKAGSTNSFQLGEIILMRLPKMKHVWNGLPQGGLTFGRLQRMKVVECESLKSLFPSSVAKNMTQFKELLVMDYGVEEIIAEKDGVGMSASDLFFPQLTDLRLLELPKLGSFCQNSHTLVWPLLKQLRVRHCGKMRSFLFACEFQGCQGTTTNKNQSALFSFEKVISHLEGLTLTMEDVMMMMPQHYVFRHLKEVSLACYHDKNVTFPSNFLLHRFPNLETLKVICSSLEEIFPEDSSGHEGAISCGELTDMEKPLQALRNLNRLSLYKLCNLKQVWKDGSLMAEILKQIEVLWVEECSRLPIVLPSPISFQRLTQLAVKDCSGLVHVGTCSTATRLVHLTWLSLRNCGAMEDVVTDDGNGVEEISFPKLRQLELIDLLSLESFSPINCTFRFPSLVYIVVMKCPKMNIFCNGALRTPYLDKVLLSEQDGEWRWEGDLNTTIRTLSA